VDKLYLSQFALGGSCHTFGESVDFHLKARQQSFVQGYMSITLDKLVDEGVLPQPDHLKIDVDGLEHLVLLGAKGVLDNPQLKSVLVELNTHLAEHREIIDRMQALGYGFEQGQVDIAIRRQDAFEGIGNYIFYRPESSISFGELIFELSAEQQAKAIDYEAAKS